MNDYLNSLSGTEIRFRVNACVSKGVLKGIEYFEADCETADGGLPFKAVATQKFGVGNTYTKVIELREKEAAEGKVPYKLSEPAPPQDFNTPRPESSKAEVPEGLNPNANMDYLASINHGYTPEQIALMEANSIIPPHTPQPIITDFLATCRMRGANPFIKDIYLIKRPSEKYGDKYSKVDSIGFMRKKAAGTGKMAGTEFWFDGLNAKEWARSADPQDYPKRITCIAFRREYQGAERDSYEYTINTSDYVKAGKKNPLYESQTLAMITKCANAAAFRLAFPEVLAESYVEEEFAKSSQDLSSVTFQEATVLLSLPEAQAQMDLAEQIEDAAERRKALAKIFKGTAHLEDLDLKERLQHLASA